MGVGSTPARSAMFLDSADELLAEWDGAAVEVGGPEHRFAAVDEEAARRGSVGDDAPCADAESCVGELLVGGDPAARVALPAEFGECLVESLGERGQDCLGVEVRGSQRLPRCFHGQKPRSAR